jgi:hypothetical protein
MDLNDVEKDKSLLELPAVPDGRQPDEASQSQTMKRAGSERNPELDMSQTHTAQQFPASIQQQNYAKQTGGVPVDDGVANLDAAADDSSATDHAPVTPQIADDVDLIEKEWVEKAKQIVNQTKEDPNLQSTEIDKFKTDYIKKRFNKEKTPK